jgi:hypothetical protein
VLLCIDEPNDTVQCLSPIHGPMVA